MSTLNTDSTSTPPIEQSLSVFAMMSQLESQMWKQNMTGWLIDLFIDDDMLYAIIGDEGRLYRASVTVMKGQATLGDQRTWDPVEINHVPTTPEEESPPDHTPVNQIPINDDPALLPLMGQSSSSSFSIQRMANGDYRWLSLAATAIMNRSGQLDTRELFDSFVADIEETKVYPTLRFFHLMSEEFVLGTTDFVARDGFCYIATGLLDTDQIYTEPLMQDMAENPGYWGTSIGFFLNDEPTILDFGGVAIPTFHSGRNHEISVLPEKDAACLRTSFAIAQTRETNLMDPRIKDALARLNADPTAIESDVDQANELAEDPTVISRSVEEADPVEQATDPIEEPDPIEQATDPIEEPDTIPEAIVEVDGAFIKAVEQAVDARLEPFNAAFIDAVTQAVDAIADLREAFAGVEADLAELKDQQIADAQADLVAQAAELSPAVAMRLSVAHRPSQANKGNKEQTPEQRRSTMADTAEKVLSGLPQY